MPCEHIPITGTNYTIDIGTDLTQKLTLKINLENIYKKDTTREIKKHRVEFLNLLGVHFLF